MAVLFLLDVLASNPCRPCFVPTILLGTGGARTWLGVCLGVEFCMCGLGMLELGKSKWVKRKGISASNGGVDAKRLWLFIGV